MIKKAQKAQAGVVAELAAILWDEHAVEELTDEFEKIIDNPKAVIFLKEEENAFVGFAQCRLRCDYVEGTKTSPVGYLEGIFIREMYRNRGYAKELLTACEAWARSEGCKEFAGDCELGNDVSLKFHLQSGFEEANRIICFTKKL